MSVYEVARLDELARIPVEEGLEWRPIRRRFGIQAFGTNAYTSERVGAIVVEEHSERSGHEELYFVVSGRARFTVGEEEVDAPAGTIVFISDPTFEDARSHLRRSIELAPEFKEFAAKDEDLVAVRE